MIDYAGQLERLRLAVEDGNLPPDLGEWLLGVVIAAAPAAVRRVLRDRLLIAAARELVSPDASTHQRALAIEAELAALERRIVLSGPQQLLVEALKLDPYTPRTARQLHTVLKSMPSRFPTDLQHGFEHDAPHVDSSREPSLRDSRVVPTRRAGLLPRRFPPRKP